MEEYLAQRMRLIATAVPSAESARELAALTDVAVRELVRAATSQPPGRWAIAALGGWGAGALLPASDLDLLILSDAPANKLKPFVEELLYPLWDSGLAVGHQVRSPKQQLRAIREDIATCAATLTARPLAGDTDWCDAVIDTCVRDAQKRRRQIMRELWERPRPGSPYLLEPDLKEGAGGRRDYDELVWTAAIESGIARPSLAHLQDAGALTSLERACVEQAAELTAAARWEAQRNGRSDSKMTLEAASDMTVDTQRVQCAVADTANVLLRVRTRMAGGTVASTSLSPEEVLAMLEAGAVSTLEQAVWDGRLDALVPGYRTLLSLRRPGLTHDLTVGAHSIKAACAIPGICSTAEGPLRRSCEAVADRPALALAALLHDVGKIDGGSDHPRRGAEPAHDAALSFGLRPSRAQEVADLVRLHLVLIETATRDDIADEDTVLRAAARLGRRELVAPLHVLTVADSVATGPGSWGAWQDSLLGTLVSRVDAALTPEVDGAGLASRGEAVRKAALTSLDAQGHASAASFVATASLRYLAEHTPEEVVTHAGLVASLEPGQPAAYKLSVSPGRADDSFTVSVVAKDRPELFSRIAGALSLAGLDILSAEAYGTQNGLALDVFGVRSATLAAVEHSTWARLERFLRAALLDRLQLETRLHERRKHYPAPSDSAARVEVDTSGYGTLLRVHAPDRVGLLYDISRAITAAGLDIRWARVLTANGSATDVFSVVGDDGEPAVDHGVIGHAVMGIRERL